MQLMGQEGSNSMRTMDFCSSCKAVFPQVCGHGCMPLGLAVSFCLVHFVQAILAAEGQCQHCQDQWKHILGTKGDRAHAPGQSKKLPTVG